MEVIKKLREQRGEIGLRLSLMLLLSVLLFLVVFNIRHAYQITDMVIDKTNEAVLAQAALNGHKTTSGVREGAAVDRSDSVYSIGVLELLQKDLGGTLNGSSLLRDRSFLISNLTTHFVNAEGSDLHFTTTLELTIYLIGRDNLALTRTLEVNSTYEARF